MEPKSLRSTTLQDAVYEQLLREITSGLLPPGTRITIEEIAKRFNVSSQPVREAIRRLEAARIISITNRRITVERLSAKQFDDIMSVYLVVGRFAVQEAAKSRSEESLKTTKKVLERLTAATEFRDLVRLGRELMWAIYGEAKNPIIMDVLTFLFARYDVYLRASYETFQKSDMDRLLKIYKGILAAFTDRNKKKIGELYCELMTTLAARMRKTLEIGHS
jgi:DNA-binding GntR family transcriptional regulator